MGNDIDGKDVGDLVFGIVAEEDAGQIVVFQHGEGETAGGALHGGFHHVGEEAVATEVTGGDIDGLKEAGGKECGAVVLDLEKLNVLADVGRLGEVQGVCVFKEGFAGFIGFHGEEGEVCLVIDGEDLCLGGLGAIRELKLEIGGIGNHFPGGENLAGSDDGTERADLAWGCFFPGLASVPALAGGVDADYGLDERRGFLGGSGFLGRGGGLGFFRGLLAGCEENSE